MTKAAAVLVVLFILAPAPDQCDQPVFARANPGLCYPGPPSAHSRRWRW
jgi:hypothetical protein